MRYIYIILLLASTSALKANSLDTIPKKGHPHLQHIPGMNRQQFEEYRNSTKMFDKRIFAIWNDQSLDKNAKGAAIENVMKEKRTWLQQHLSDEQRKQLAGFQRQYAISSPREMERKKMEDRLNSKGIKVSHPKDSL